MPDLGTLSLFASAALALLLVPGPAVLYIVTRSATQGRRAGLVSVLGIHVGTLVHIGFAVAGLSAIVVASSRAFTTIRLAGALYLVFLGVQALWRARGPVETGGAEAIESRSIRRVFVDGIVLNILNPKTALFFLAFVPQFVDVEAGHTTLQLLVLGATFILIGLVTDGGYSLAAGWLGHRVAHSPRFDRGKDLAAGMTYLGLGTITALSGQSTASN